MSETGNAQPTRGCIHRLEIWWTASGEGTLPGWGTQRPEPQSPGGGWDLVSRGLAPRDRTGRLGRWFCWALPPPLCLCLSFTLSVNVPPLRRCPLMGEESRAWSCDNSLKATQLESCSTKWIVGRWSRGKKKSPGRGAGKQTGACLPPPPQSEDRDCA